MLVKTKNNIVSALVNFSAMQNPHKATRLRSLTMKMDFEIVFSVESSPLALPRLKCASIQLQTLNDLSSYSEVSCMNRLLDFCSVAAK